MKFTKKHIPWNKGKKCPQISEGMIGNKNGIGHIVSIEQRKKLKKRMIGNTITRFRKKPWNKGLTKKTDRRIKEMSEKISLAERGKKHWNWQGGITPIQMQIRNSDKYKQWRDSVYKRDHWTCQECGKKCESKNIVAHHIKPFSQYPKLRFEVDNGITLCRKCHLKLHKSLIKKL